MIRHHHQKSSSTMVGAKTDLQRALSLVLCEVLRCAISPIRGHIYLHAIESHSTFELAALHRAVHISCIAEPCPFSLLLDIQIHQTATHLIYLSTIPNTTPSNLAARVGEFPLNCLTPFHCSFCAFQHILLAVRTCSMLSIVHYGCLLKYWHPSRLD